MQVDFYFSIDSRYSYLAATQIPSIEAEFGVTIGWKPLQFAALMAARGDDPFAENRRAGQYVEAYRNTDVHRWANYYKVPMVAPDWAADWQRIALAAVASVRFDCGQAFCFALYAAIMQDQTTPKSDADLVRIAEKAGLDGTGLVAAIDDPKTAELHQQHIDDAKALGIFGVPTFAVGTEIFWGNDRLVLLRHRLRTRVLL